MCTACSRTTASARAWLSWIARRRAALAYEAEVERVLDELAAHLAAHIDLDRLLGLAR